MRECGVEGSLRTRLTVFLETPCFLPNFRVEWPRFFCVPTMELLFAGVTVMGRPERGRSSSVSAFCNLFFQNFTVDRAQPTVSAVSRKLHPARSSPRICNRCAVRPGVASFCRGVKLFLRGIGKKRKQKYRGNQEKDNQETRNKKKVRKMRIRLLQREGRIVGGEGKFYMCILGWQTSRDSRWVHVMLMRALGGWAENL